MRDPAIHIRCSDFVAIAQEYGLNVRDVNQIMQEAFKYSIRSRVFVTTKSAGKKKVDSLVESDTNLLNQFTRIYTGCMLSHSIKSLSIGKTSPQYKTLCEVCHQAKEFSDMNGMSYEEGFITFIELGIKLLGNKFGIYRLKGTALKIVEYHQAKTLIKNDPSPDKTDIMVLAWSTAVRTYYHTTIELENDAQRTHFIHAKEEADAANADYYDWIYAQFEKYLYLNSIPSFSQFYGDQAKLNYQLYTAKGNKENTSKEEKEYFNTVKNAKEIPLKATEQETRIRKERLHSSL
jgi:hypothetical protein